jgi:hypothetical protein
VTTEAPQRNRWRQLQRAVKCARWRRTKEACQPINVVGRARAQGAARYGCNLAIGGNDLGEGERRRAALINKATGMIAVEVARHNAGDALHIDSSADQRVTGRARISIGIAHLRARWHRTSF